MIKRSELIPENLSLVLAEISAQPEIRSKFCPGIMGFDQHIEQLREYLEVNEYGLAYELIVCLLEDFPFVLSGRAAIKLLEAGLLMKFKTDRAQDAEFDSR